MHKVQIELFSWCAVPPGRVSLSLDFDRLGDLLACPVFILGRDLCPRLQLLLRDLDRARNRELGAVLERHQAAADGLDRAFHPLAHPVGLLAHLGLGRIGLHLGIRYGRAERCHQKRRHSDYQYLLHRALLSSGRSEARRRKASATRLESTKPEWTV